MISAHQSAGLVAALSLLGATPAFAHALLVSVRGEGSAVAGTIYYSDGTPGVGEYVRVEDLTDPTLAPRAGPTDAQGRFRHPGVVGHRYRVVAEGEEGHVTEMQLTLGSDAKGEFIDVDAESGSRLPPAWVVIGGLLLLSVIPALMLRRRQRRLPAPIPN